jgi:MFS family permease
MGRFSFEKTPHSYEIQLHIIKGYYRMISTDIKKLRNDHPDYVSEVERNYRWNFIALVLDSSIFSFSIAMLSTETILPYFVSHLSDKSFWIGVIPALFFLGLFFPQLFGAYLVNGKPLRKKAIFWIAITERIGILFIAVVAQFTTILPNDVILALFLISFTLFAITNGLIAPAYSDFISKNIMKNRGIFFGSKEFIGGLIGLGASLTATYLLNTYAFPINMRTLFWIGFGTSFISPFIIATFKEIPYPIQTQVEPLKDFLKCIPEMVKKQAGFQKYLIARAVFGVGLLANSFYALYAIDKYNLSEGVLGVFTMIILLTKCIFGFIWGYLGDRFGYKVNYICSSALLILMGILAVTSPGVWVFYVIAFGIGAVMSVIMTSDPNMVFELAPPSETSRFIGIANTIIAPVMTFAPIVGGLIVDLSSYKMLFSVEMLISILALGVILKVMPNPRNQEN